MWKVINIKGQINFYYAFKNRIQQSFACKYFKTFHAEHITYLFCIEFSHKWKLKKLQKDIKASLNCQKQETEYLTTLTLE